MMIIARNDTRVKTIFHRKIKKTAARITRTAVSQPNTAVLIYKTACLATFLLRPETSSNLRRLLPSGRSTYR
jgi:hypothetical protein